MRRLLGIDRLEQALMQATGQAPSGQAPAQNNGGGGLWQLVDHVVDAAAKIIDKLPPQVFGASSDGDSSLVKRIGEEVVIRAAQQTGINVPIKPIVPIQHVVTP